MKKIRKSSALLIVCILIAITLSACSDDDEKDENTLEVIYRGPDDTLESWLNNVKEQFEDEHDGMKVDVTAIQADEGDYPNKKVLMMKSDKTSPDVVFEDTEQMKPDTGAGYLEPMTDELEDWSDWDQFIGDVKEGVKGEDEEYYGVPITTDVRGLWYNKKVFADAGIDVPWEPETWEDVMKAADSIKDDVEVPFWMNSAKAMGESTTMQTFLMFLYGTDSELYDEENEQWVVESDGFLDSLKFIDNVYKNDLGASLSWGITGQAGEKVFTELMPEDEVGIALDGNFANGAWKEDGNAPWPEWDESYDFVAMPTQHGQDPGVSAVSGGNALSIPKKSDKKHLAMDFIKLATSKENLKVGTQLTPRKDIADSDEYNEETYQEKMTDLLDHTNYRPAYSEYPEVSSSIQDAVENVATGSTTPEKAMEQFKEDVKRDLDEDSIKTE